MITIELFHMIIVPSLPQGEKLLQKFCRLNHLLTFLRLPNKVMLVSLLFEITLKKYQVLLLKISSRDILCINQ
jgi:hypothetical protein